jgi:HaeII restriction endonuclease
MTLEQAKAALDRIIKISRVHLYKPIQIAEILHRHRVSQDIDLTNIDTYRNTSKVWRDAITNRFVGRSSSSSAEYQEALFTKAIPPQTLVILGEENRLKGGIIEAYIYRRFAERFTQLSSALRYCDRHDLNNFEIQDFIELFWNEPGLRRSIDKVYEIVVYSLFSVLVEALEVTITIGINQEKLGLLAEFADFTEMVIGLTPDRHRLNLPAKIYRVGVTNAADRGLDMYANFGMAIQIKHLSLTPELAENIVGSVTADRIVIVCRDSEQALIVSLLNQIGWRAKIQSIITESDLTRWYQKALRGSFGKDLGSRILLTLKEQIIAEFPASDNQDFTEFYESRNYNLLTDDLWI